VSVIELCQCVLQVPNFAGCANNCLLVPDKSLHSRGLFDFHDYCKIAVTLIIGNCVQPHSKTAKDTTLEWGTHAVELRGQPKAMIPTCDIYLAGIRSNLPELSV
jgi:hypothetical protein